MRFLIWGSLAIVFLGAGMWLYGAHGPWYRTTVLEVPIVFEELSARASWFRVDKSERYRIELRADSVLPPETMDRILGDRWQRGAGSELRLEWRLLERGELVGTGTNEHGEVSTFRFAGGAGLDLGGIDLKRGNPYLLSLQVSGADPGWQACSPRFLVRLHPSRLEYLILLRYLGLRLGLLGAALVVLLLPLAALRLWLARGPRGPSRLVPP